MKQVYIPLEDILYGMSVLTGNIDPNSPEYIFRLNAFADLIENYILSEQVLFDDMGINLAPMGAEIKSIIERNGLDSGFKQIASRESPFEEFAPVAIDAITAYNETTSEFNREQLIKQKIPSLDIFLSQKRDELKDYISFVWLNLFDELQSEPLAGYLSLKDLTEEEKTEQALLTALIFAALAEGEITTSIDKNLPNIPSVLKAGYMFNTPVFSPSSKVFLDKFTDLKYEKSKALNDFVFNTYTKEFRLPILLNYIISKAGSAKEIIQIATELKHSKQLIAFRNFCAELDNHIVEGNQEDAIKLIREIDKLTIELNKRDQVKEDKQISVQLSFPPAINFNVSLPHADKRYVGFLKKIYLESKSPIVLQSKLDKIMRTAGNSL